MTSLSTRRHYKLLLKRRRSTHIALAFEMWERLKAQAIERSAGIA